MDVNASSLSPTDWADVSDQGSYMSSRHLFLIRMEAAGRDSLLTEGESYQHTQTHTHTHTHTHTYAHMHARTHARTHTHTDTHNTHHTHTTPHTHTHTHTHVGFYGLRGLSIGVMVFILYKLYVLFALPYPTPKFSPHRRRCLSIFPQKNSV